MRTFDGLIYNLTLHCSHLLTQDSYNGNFKVVLSACPAGAKQPCPHVLHIVINKRDEYSFLTEHGHVIVYINNDTLPIPSNINGIDIKLVRNNVRIYLDQFDMEIVWDKHHFVSLKVPPNLFRQTRGLCGPFDNDMDNDILSTKGQRMSIGESFLEEWREKIYDAPDAVCIDSKPPAHVSITVSRKAHDICTKLYSQPEFSECANEFDIDDLIEKCVDDYISCNDGVHHSNCACDGLTAISKVCQMKGINIRQGWKNKDICRKLFNNFIISLEMLFIYLLIFLFEFSFNCIRNKMPCWPRIQ